MGLQTETPNKKKGRSIVVVDKKEMVVSVDKVSVEKTEVKGSSVMETKTPTKSSKKKRKSMAVGQIKTDVSVENVVAKAIEIPQESSVIASETPSKKKNTSIAVDRKKTVSGENVSAEAPKLKESIVLETKTPTKKRKKIRKSMSVSQEKNLTPVENGSVKANHIIKESSVIQTPNKTSKNRSKPMAVLNEKSPDCETKVVNKVKENKVKLSELQTETPNKKKGRSIVVVDKKEMVVSVDKVSVEKTEVKGSSVMETKTPTKSSKKKRKSMAVGQIKTDVSVEN